jgi:hypothetical protein
MGVFQGFDVGARTAGESSPRGLGSHETTGHNSVIARRPQADVAISIYEIATVALLLLNDNFEERYPGIRDHFLLRTK